MSRADLDLIQKQLKAAIQSHQNLVAKMKSDPQNAGLHKQLHDLQSEITGLSEKQKSIVQLLRKELVSKQGPTTTTQTVTKVMPSVSAISSTSNQPPPPKPPQPQSVAATTAMVTTAVSRPLSAQQAPPAPMAPMAPMAPKGPRLPLSVASSTITVNNNNTIKSTPPTKCPSTLIRVPQYPIHKPSILQGSHASLSPRLIASPAKTSVSRSVRHHSDSDLQTYRKSSLERKELPPEEKRKLEFMASLDLITPDILKELQSKRSERKRRSTANPQFSYGHFEPERKRKYLSTPHVSNTITLVPGQRRRGRPPKHPRPVVSTPITMVAGGGRIASPLTPVTPGSLPGIPNEASDIHDDLCAVCQRSGELLMCDTCHLVYHLACLEPPITIVPQGFWSCPKCQSMNKQGNSNPNWAGTLALVHSYISHKAGKEEEKKKLEKRNRELDAEKSHLHTKTQQLTSAITNQMKQKQDLLSSNKSTQQSVDKLKNFIRVFQTS